MNYLRIVKYTDNSTMVNDYRPVQGLNGRVVKKTVSRKLRKPLLFQQIDISVGLFSLMMLTAYYSLSSFFHSRII